MHEFRFLTKRQAAQLAGGASVRSVERWFTQGLPRHGRPNGVALIDPAELKAFLRRQPTDLDSLVRNITDEVLGKPRLLRQSSTEVKR